MKMIRIISVHSFSFFRRGKVGGYADEMSKEYIEKFDKWSAERFQGFDFKFAI